MKPTGQIFHPLAGTLFRVAIVGGAGLLLLSPFVGYWLYRTSYATDVGITLEQPIPFSHKHHVGGLGIDCRYCHSTVERAASAGMPSSQVCMSCHSQIWTNAAVLAPLRESFSGGTPISWQRVHRLPDFVFFNHGIHVHAGAACATCHGRVDQMPLMRKEQPLTMQWCLSCHRNPDPFLGAREDVFRMPPVAGSPPKSHPNPRRLTDCVTCHR